LPDSQPGSFFGSSARATGARCTRPRWACRQPAADRIPAPGIGPGAQPEGKEHMPEQSSAHHLREYETIFLVKPDLTDEGVDRVKERVRGIVNREGGELLRFTVVGEKETRYLMAE